PSNINIHSVQSISQLTKASQEPMLGQVQRQPSVVLIDREEEHEVGKIDDLRIFRTQLQYVVKWRHYGK
ncbi:hypothetical protein K440DRAFT_557797, partial [Wilcoxina mikolae CBS 423.85]